MGRNDYPKGAWLAGNYGRGGWKRIEAIHETLLAAGYFPFLHVQTIGKRRVRVSSVMCVSGATGRVPTFAGPVFTVYGSMRDWRQGGLDARAMERLAAYALSHTRETVRGEAMARAGTSLDPATWWPYGPL